MKLKIIIITSIVLVILLIGYLIYNITVIKQKEKEKIENDEKIFKSSNNQSRYNITSFKSASQTVLSEGLIILGALAISDFIRRLINICIPSKNKKYQLLVQFGITILIIGLTIISLYLLNLSFHNDYNKL